MLLNFKPTVAATQWSVTQYWLAVVSSLPLCICLISGKPSTASQLKDLDETFRGAGDSFGEHLPSIRSISVCGCPVAMVKNLQTSLDASASSACVNQTLPR